MRIVPYGAWPSPLSPEAASGARVSLSNLVVTPDGVWWWSESRPDEGGRQVVVRRPPGGSPDTASPDGVSVRTRVHEYGGAAFAVAEGTLLYVALDDEGLWELAPGTPQPRRLSPVPPAGERHRYGEPQPVPGGPWVVAVRERHHGGVVDDEVVVLRRGATAPATVLAAGRDFFAAPRLSPDGSALAWVTWDHPNMPWDATELWVAPFRAGGEAPPALGPAVRVAGGPDESVGQPTWAPDGSLCFVSDRHGWWQPFRWEPGAHGVGGDARRLCAVEAEFHAPDWALGQATLAPLADGRLVCRFRRAGSDGLGLVGPDGSLEEIDQPCVSIVGVRAAGAGAVGLIGSPPDAPVAVHRVPVPPADAGSPSAGTPVAGAGSPVVVHRPRPAPLAAGWVSAGAGMAFPTAGGQEAHLLHFPPAGPDLAGPPGEAPPLVVVCHGGPTGAAEAGFDLGVQLWTSRGFAVALVDYRGSAGYGRAYRRLLQGQWGLADAEDCMAAARFLAGRGEVDGDRMLARGSSAGGLTALRALRPGGPFRAALVSYGVTDLRALARDTHKFESRYLDGLVGPWPEAVADYEARSPALHPEEIEGAVLLLQGDEDPVVPPDQARALAAALGARGGRCQLELFAGEGHGFRRADTLARAARLELDFAMSVLGIPSPT